jgi:hypothetical protein
VNQSEIYTLARNAGLADDRAKIAAAIAMAESGGNPAAHTRDSDDDSYGLWQINMIGALGPARRAEFNLKTDAELLIPATNARVMSELSQNGQNFSKWTTFTGGKYKAFLGNPVSMGTAPGATPGGADPGVLDTVVRAGDALTKTTRWVSNPRNWLRVAYVLGGGLLVYAAVETLVLPYTSKAVGTVLGAAGPAGKLAKKVVS